MLGWVGGGGGGYAPPPTDKVLNDISQEFKYEEIQYATSNFSSSNRLGEGSYGTVFRGVLKDGTEVAIKALSQPKEGGFKEEVQVLSKFRHPNLVILLGFARGPRKERYLVYEFLSGGDLHARLEKDRDFNWERRLNVALDAALGLSHLHGSNPQVFHRDVKTQNILLDKNGSAKVADFGLALLAENNKHSMKVHETSGTIGYADPNYIRSGVVTEKSEVYSAGMVILEILTGRPPALQHPSGKIAYQFEHVKDLADVVAMLDRRANFPIRLVERVGNLALSAIHKEEHRRPTFVQIVTDLRTWLRDKSLHGAMMPAQVHGHNASSSSSSYVQRAGIQGPLDKNRISQIGGGGATEAYNAIRAAQGYGHQSAIYPNQQPARESHQPHHPSRESHQSHQVSDHWRRAQQAVGVGQGHAKDRLAQLDITGNGNFGQQQQQRQSHRGPGQGGEQQSHHADRRSTEGERERRLLEVVGAADRSGVAPRQPPQQASQQSNASQQARRQEDRRPDARRQEAQISGERRQQGVHPTPDRKAPAPKANAEPPQEALPPPKTASKEEMIQILKGFGYSDSQANEASKRCSSVEAAVEFLLQNS